VAWLYVFAQTWQLLYLPWVAYVSLGLAVWVIYVADRLLDVSLLGGPSAKLEARHEFHNRHRKLFQITAIAAALVVLILAVTKMPGALFEIFRQDAGVGLLPIGALLVAGFFGLSMLSSQQADEVPHTKNILAGITFAFGTAMTAHLFRREYESMDLLVSREFVCFAVLCILNISAIDLWEHAERSADLEIKASDELALTLPLMLLGAAALLYAVFDSEQSARPFFYAILTGAALLYILNRKRSQFSMDSLRVLADVALLVPVLVFVAASQE
jgi:cytochrome bd-type quinol oxidase subunit 2